MSANAFQTSTDIANRACQRVGAKRIATTLATDTSRQAQEINFCYDKLRQAELRRNIWRFATRRTVLRAVGTPFQDWDSTLTYADGAYVQYNGINYVSLQAANTNQEPDTATTYWQVYLGLTTLQLTFPTWAVGTAYSQGEIAVGSDSRPYMCTTANTGQDPTSTTGYWTLHFGTGVASQWDSEQTYMFGEVVFYTINTTCYICVSNGNTNDPTTSNSGWVALTGTAVAPLFIPWPAGAGPANETDSLNVFMLPLGYIRKAPQTPAAGRTSFLGFPGNQAVKDWIFEGNYLLSMDTGPIDFRYIADVIDVTMMDPMFCEGLACRIGMEVCEALTQSTAKINDCEGFYKQFMREARNIDGIEQGPTEPPLDDFILTRF